MSTNSLDRYTFEDSGRIYTDHDDLWLPSVSTVLGARDKPPELKSYLNRTSQAKQDQKTFYTQNRGTLVHWNLLQELVEDLPWTDDEEKSRQCLRGNREHDETGLRGDYETWQRYKQDMEWAESAWEMIRRIYDIRPDTTLGAEIFVKNKDVQYAGQFDLLSTDPDNGAVVLRDLKTSKRVYDKHLLQLVAYAHAVNIEVDRCEVIRINPDSKTWEVSQSTNWMDDEDELWSEFVDLRDSLDTDAIDDLKERAQDQ